MRTTRTSVTFDRPFTVSAMDEVQPAGTYTVEIDEELIDGLSFLAYRRVATTIFLPFCHGRGGSMQAVRVDPGELAAVYGQVVPAYDGGRTGNRHGEA